MTAPLRLNIRSEREWMLLKNLANGYREFNDFSLEERYILYTSAVEIEDFVDDVSLMQFERQMAIESEMQMKERGRMMAQSLFRQARGLIGEPE